MLRIDRGFQVHVSGLCPVSDATGLGRLAAQARVLRRGARNVGLIENRSHVREG